MSQNKNPKVKTVTVPVEFIRQAIVMRQRQRKYFAGRNPADIPAAKQSEADFDKMLANISNELKALNIPIDNPSQDTLL